MNKMNIIHFISKNLTQAFEPCVPIPSFLWSPLQRIADAFLAIALFTLGAQIAHARINAVPPLVVVSVLGRLLLSLILALFILSQPVPMSCERQKNAGTRWPPPEGR